MNADVVAGSRWRRAQRVSTQSPVALAPLAALLPSPRTPPDMPSCRISAAATTTSPPTLLTATGSTSPSTTSRSLSEPTQHLDHASACAEMAQRNSALRPAHDGYLTSRSSPSARSIMRTNPPMQHCHPGHDWWPSFGTPQESGNGCYCSFYQYIKALDLVC